MVNISIIMPVYNKKKYLRNTLNSILNQTYKEFELILIDDGSNDGSEKICDEFSDKDKRIKVIHIKNSGVSNARNIGLENAKGKYIQFIDSDDYIEDTMLEELYDIMEKYKPDIVVSGITKVNHQYEIIKEILPRLNGIKNRIEILENFAYEQFKTGIYGCVSNKLIKRSIIENLNLRFDTNIKLAEDLNFYLDIYSNISNAYFYSKSLYYYIQNTENSSTSDNIENDYYTQILISKKQKDMLYKNNILSEENKNIIDFVITKFTICYIYDKFSFNYSEFNKNLQNISNDILQSLLKDKQNVFNKLIIFFVTKNMIIQVYLLLASRTVCRNIYRKFKNIIKR